MSWWATNCIKGAAKYLSMPRRSQYSQMLVAGTCAGCRHLQIHQEDDVKGLCGWLAKHFVHAPCTGWCGEPGVKGPRTCGCLVCAEATEPTGLYVTVKGVPIQMGPAGKTTVSGDPCPSGKWS